MTTRDILGLLLAAIFAVLGLLHVYWAIGGKSGGGAAVPTVNDVAAFSPSPQATLMVAAALFAAMLVILGCLGWFGETIPNRLFRVMTLVISLAFLLRAVGDFRLVGFFKPATESAFAYWDTWLYSPLCLFISVAAFFVAWRAE
jgi:hypothetical protein